MLKFSFYQRGFEDFINLGNFPVLSAEEKDCLTLSPRAHDGST